MLYIQQFYCRDDLMWTNMDSKLSNSIDNLNKYDEITKYDGSNHVNYMIKKIDFDYAILTEMASLNRCDLRRIVYHKPSKTRIVWEYLGKDNFWNPIKSCDLIIELTNAIPGSTFKYYSDTQVYNVVKHWNGKNATQINVKTGIKLELRIQIYDPRVTDWNFESFITDFNDFNISTCNLAEWTEMVVLFTKTMPSNKCTVENLYKIDCKNHKNVYERILYNKANNINGSERTLFHGTSKDSIDKIISNGFNRDFNVKHRYGKGVYFAKYALKADQYCKMDNNGYYYMLICRVFVGDYTRGRHDMITPPLKNDGKTQYDSLVDNINDPTIFVISKDYHAIPEYIIKYKRK